MSRYGDRSDVAETRVRVGTHRRSSVAAVKPTSSVGRVWPRPVAGLITVLIIGLAIAMVAVLFRGDLNSAVPVTVMSPARDW